VGHVRRAEELGERRGRGLAGAVRTRQRTPRRQFQPEPRSN